jgi:ATP-dependent Lon protease
MSRIQSEDRDISGFQRIAYGSKSLLVPACLVDAIEREQEAKRSEERVVKPSVPYDLVVSEPVPSPVPTDYSEPFVPATFSVQVFPEESIKRAAEESKQRDEDSKSRIKASIAAAQRRKGRRLIPDIELEVITGLSTGLHRRFPNFRRVIDHLETELAIAMASTAEAFRLTPIVLYGSPGIGKTAFSMAMAEMLGVGFDRVSAAGLQGGFELVGTSSHWSNAGPGKVFNLLAGGDYASPVLVIDEIDKISIDERYPIIPALLELLEPVSARDFMDQSMSLRFDASKIIVVATANNLDAIPEPLLSRLQAIEVLAPTENERRLIASTVFHEIVKGLHVNIRILDDALDRIAMASIDIRALGRVLREAIGRKVRERKNVIEADDLHVTLNRAPARIGFV